MNYLMRVMLFYLVLLVLPGININHLKNVVVNLNKSF